MSGINYKIGFMFIYGIFSFPVDRVDFKIYNTFNGGGVNC